jgi:hypothetical protein
MPKAANYHEASPRGGYVRRDDSKPWDSASLGFSEKEGGVPLYNAEDIKDALSEYNLSRFFSAMLAEGEALAAPRVEIRRRCWALYNNEYDWSDKAWWQHRAPIPKVRTAVDKAVALFRKTLLRMNPFYGIQAESRMGRTKGRFTMLLTDYHFDQSSIIESLVDAFKVGLITSESILKIWWMRARDFKPALSVRQQEELTYEFGVPTGKLTREVRDASLEKYMKGKLGIACVNPDNYWVIPGTRGRMVIERDQATLNEVEELAEEGIYDKEAVDRLRDKLTSATTIQEDVTPPITKEGRPNSTTYLRQVDLWHFWGDIYDTQGKLAKCDASFTLANKEILVRPARDNPFFHKDPPYVMGTPYKIPFSTYHRGMVEDVMELATAITEMANLIADGALYDALKAFSIDIDQLDDPSEARQGLYPGKMFLRKSGNNAQPNEQLIQTVEVGKVPQEAMNMIGLFEKYYQEGSYINEWVAGQGGKGDRTLGEVNIKTQSALEGLDESARNLETTLIEPTLDMATRVIYQFHDDYTLARLMDNYPNVAIMLQGMQPAERYATMVGDFTFKMRGLSMMIERQQKIGELKEILQLLSYLPGFIERLNPDATLEEVLMPLGWDPSKLLINPSASSVTTPQPGAQPSPPMIPPGAPPAMEMRNAAEGARMGGARNNPVARGGNQQYSAPVGRAPMLPPPQAGPVPGQPQGALQSQLMNALRFALARNQARGLIQGGAGQ